MDSPFRELANIDIHYHAAVTDEHRRQIEKWVAANQADDIDSIAIHDRLVSVHGVPTQSALAAGTAIRGDDLADDLSAALAKMRNTFGCDALSTDARPVPGTAWPG